MNESLSRDIDRFIEENQEDIFRNIARLVAVNSQEDLKQKSDEAPFGPGPRKALDEALAIARELGLETKDCEHYLGYAFLGGEGERYLATITHVDVVPVGEGWTGDPFTMRDRDGYILGRGVQDDKGPGVICLYALKYLKEAGISLKYPIRALLGANEETGMRDVEYYLKNYPAPLFCFSPDADFPLINGEKGVYHAKLVSRHLQQGNILAIKGGVAPNVIPSRASAILRVAPENASRMDSTEWVEAVQTAEDMWQLSARGIGGHASMPEGTVNAIGKLIEYILDRELASRKETAFLRFARKAHEVSDGSALGIAADDGKFTPLTAISGMIWMEGDTIVQTLDSRFPTTTDEDTITARLAETAAGAARITDVTAQKPFWREPDCPELQACMAAYNEVTGLDAKPFAIGGGTYAKDFPNAVAFGPEHPDHVYPDFVGPIHGADEGASKAELLEALKIYIAALMNLEEMDF